MNRGAAVRRRRSHPHRHQRTAAPAQLDAGVVAGDAARDLVGQAGNHLRLVAAEQRRRHHDPGPGSERRGRPDRCLVARLDAGLDRQQERQPAEVAGAEHRGQRRPAAQQHAVQQGAVAKQIRLLAVRWPPPTRVRSTRNSRPVSRQARPARRNTRAVPATGWAPARRWRLPSATSTTISVANTATTTQTVPGS